MTNHPDRNKTKTLHEDKAPEAPAEKRLEADADKAAEKASVTQHKSEERQGIFTK